MDAGYPENWDGTCPHCDNQMMAQIIRYSKPTDFFSVEFWCKPCSIWYCGILEKEEPSTAPEDSV